MKDKTTWFPQTPSDGHTERALDPHKVPGPDWVYKKATRAEINAHLAAGGPILNPDESPHRKMNSAEMRGHIELAKIYGKREPSEEETTTYWRIWRELWISKNGVAPPRPVKDKPAPVNAAAPENSAFWDK